MILNLIIGVYEFRGFARRIEVQSTKTRTKTFIDLQFALSAIRGKLLEREREKRKRVFGYYTWVTYYP